jgi:hypothetical protein
MSEIPSSMEGRRADNSGKRGLKPLTLLSTAQEQALSVLSAEGCLPPSYSCLGLKPRSLRSGISHLRVQLKRIQERVKIK